MTTSPSPPSKGPQSQRIYYLLGAFNVLSVLVAVALNFYVVGMYESSVDSSRVWADRMARVTDVATTATEANGPGNEVFENRDVVGERAALTEIVARYDALSAEAHAELQANLPAEQHRALLEQFAAADTEFVAMLAAAERIFEEFERDNVAAAGREMAVYDRQLAATSAGFSTLRSSLADLQHAGFEAELTAAQSVRRVEFGLIALVLLMVAGILTYGNRLNRAFRAVQARIDARNQDVQVLLTNVDQGFCTISRDGVVSSERSAAFDRFFASVGADTTFGACLAQYDGVTEEWFAIALDEVFEEVLPIELTLEQLPSRVDRGETHLEMEYRPLRDETGALTHLLVVVSDVSARVEAERAEAEQREVLGLFHRILSDRPGVVDFFREATRIHEALNDGAVAHAVHLRLLHTLKGNAGLFGLSTLAEACHALETRIEASGGPLGPELLEGVNAEWERITGRLRQLLGEDEGFAIAIDAHEHEAVIAELLATDSPGARRVAARVASWTLEPVEVRMRRLAAQAQQLAHRQGKPEPRVDVQTEDLRLSPDVFGPFWSALVHVVRNAVDHGIEHAEARVEHGKPRDGHLRFFATREEERLVIGVSDDGAGIDWSAVAQKAAAAGLPHATRGELIAALFASGVSTADEVTDLSGRGVGMSAVLEAVEQLGGQVEVASKRGRGTTWQFGFPAELASPLYTLQRDEEAAA